MIKRILIVEDEPALQRSLQRKVQKFDERFEIIGLAGTVAEALQILGEKQVDLLFLDINLPDGRGFDVLEHLTKGDDLKLPLTIITTAYEEFAIEAIKANVIDYLLKPVDPEELRAAIQKAIDVASGNEEVAESPTTDRIAVFTSERVELIAPKDIVRAQSSSNYTTLYLTDGKKIVISKTLKDVEARLKPQGFIRLHQSHLVNIEHIRSLEKQGIPTVLLSDGSEVIVSNSYRSELVDLLRKQSF